MQWQKFVTLSKDYRDLQLQLLQTTLPESMDLRGLTSWGKLCSKALTFSYRVEADKEQSAEIREHWGLIRKLAVNQLERVAATVQAYMQETEEMNPWERCQIFELVGMCSELFQREADYIAQAEAGSVSSVPDCISTEQLMQIKRLRGLEA